MCYYLRFEGVNLSHFIYDTNDLSTIRGGGLLLLDAVEKVQAVIKDKLPNFKTISKGASWALFELQTDDESTAKGIKQAIIGKLNADEALCHATFVVDILKNTRNYKIDRDSLHTANRWQQMQAPSFSIPTPNETVCKYDKVRPADKNKMSLSVAKRKDYGNDQKRGDFYKARTGYGDLKFTHDLVELSKDKQRGILNGKIAIIYIDGNKFGSIAGACETPEEQKEFDKNLRDGQYAVLKSLLQIAKDNPNNWQNNGRIRLETLLWGGDELIWVVPAWLGWFTLNFFFERANADIRVDKELLNRQVYDVYDAEGKKVENEKGAYRSNNGELSFAAGLVFCHHNAPIHRMTDLAKRLADLAKKDYPYTNALAYQILESFDHAGIAIEEHRNQRLANLAEACDLLVTADTMSKLEDCVQKLKNAHFPRRKSYQLINALLNNDSELVESLLEKLQEDFPSVSDIIEELKKLCGTKNAHWLHLTDLWDYLGLNTDTTAGKHD